MHSSNFLLGETGRVTGTLPDSAPGCLLVSGVMLGSQGRALCAAAQLPLFVVPGSLCSIDPVGSCRTGCSVESLLWNCCSTLIVVRSSHSRTYSAGDSRIHLSCTSSKDPRSISADLLVFTSAEQLGSVAPVASLVMAVLVATDAIANCKKTQL